MRRASIGLKAGGRFFPFPAMPIYEFYCPKNHKIYSFFARSLELGDRVPRCPDNPEYPMEKRVSGFAVTGRAKEPGDGEGGDFDDPRLEAAMEQMEREFSGIDEDNPDPRQLAHLMRRMSDLTGEKLPEAMKEMVERMEKGEDPEQLEEEYGDLLDEAEGMDGEGDGDGAEVFGPGSVARALRRRRGPSCDPVLYEMSDYL